MTKWAIPIVKFLSSRQCYESNNSQGNNSQDVFLHSLNKFKFLRNPADVLSLSWIKSLKLKDKIKLLKYKTFQLIIFCAAHKRFLININELTFFKYLSQSKRKCCNSIHSFYFIALKWCFISKTEPHQSYK